jgi:hypothetical protein
LIPSFFNLCIAAHGADPLRINIPVAPFVAWLFFFLPNYRCYAPKNALINRIAIGQMMDQINSFVP